MAEKRSWLERFTDPGGDISEKSYQDVVDHPSMKAVNDSWNDEADKTYGEGSGTSRLGDAEKAVGNESPTNNSDSPAEGENNSPKSYYESAKANPRPNRKLGLNSKRKIGLALGGGGLVGALLGMGFMLLPLKIPALLQTIADEAGQRVEQVAERRAMLQISRAIAQKFATSGSGLVIQGGIFDTMVASMRTNNFEKRLQDKGLKIIKDGDGVKLEFKGEKIKGGQTLKGEKAVYEALDGKPLTRKMINDIVKEDIPSWRWMKRAKFAKWLRHKYGIPRFGTTNSKEKDSKKAVRQMKKERLANEARLIIANMALFAECIAGPIKDCSLTRDGNARPDTMKESAHAKDIPSATDEAVQDTIAEYEKNDKTDLSNFFTQLLIKKFGTSAAVNAIPVVGQIISAIDTASIVNHMLKDQAEVDFIGKAVAGLRGANYAQLYGNWAGYASQNALGALRPDYISDLAEQTVGVEKSQAFNYIAGNTLSGSPITLFNDKVYATTPSDIPGVPVDRVDSNNPGVIKEKMDKSGITAAIIAVNKSIFGFTLEFWYETIGQGGLAGWVMDRFATIITFIVKLIDFIMPIPQNLKDWVNDAISKLWLKILAVFNLDFNPFVTGPYWFNNAHAGATVSYNQYGDEVGMRKLSPLQASIQNRSIAEERAEYIKDKGLLYALFSPEVNTSLTTQLAIASPSDPSKIGQTITSTLASLPSTLVRSLVPKAYAANPYVDLYGIDPYGATTADLNAPLSDEFIAGEECPDTEEGDFNSCTVDNEVARAMICEFEPDSDGCAEGDTPLPETTGAGTEFRIASYNIKTGSSKQWNINSTNQMDRNGFQVVGLQEAERWPTYSSITSKLKKLGYGVYPDISNPDEVYRNGLNARTIAYKTNKFEFIKADEVTFRRMDDPQQPAHAPIVWLRDRQTGQQIIVINTHNSANVQTTYSGSQQRYDAGVNYIQKIKQLKAEGLPIFFTGDFNEGWGVRHSRNVTLDKDYRNLFYCMLKANDNLLMHVEDVVKSQPAECNQSRGYGPVDHIYVSPGVKVTKSSTLSGTNNQLGTDHDRVPYADVQVPSSGSDAPSSAGWTWPMKTGLKPGPCWNTSVGGRMHAGMDINTDSSTAPAIAMHDGVVIYKGSGGGADGNSIIVKTTTGKLYWYQHLSSVSKNLNDNVKSGDKLGVVGKTGSVSAPNSNGHLHIVLFSKEGDFPSYDNLQSSMDPMSVLPKPAPEGYACY